MSKKTVHIISHSHWDREWYLPFESHRMRLVRLVDQVLDLFDQDPNYRYFHLDGQTLPLDDYLQVRPQQEARLRQAIQSGKLRIGPFYILQDAFLISGEATVRNGLLGHQALQAWGVAGEQLGYYPDTFGLTGQTPQITRRMGMSMVAFGRGVKPTGFDNQVFAEGDYQSAFSELNWQSPNGEGVLGLLFANWYSNGNEIPIDPEQAKTFWDQKLADAERYAVSDQLLMMNGCDHQPAQVNLSKAIQLANQLYPDYNFIHSNFTLYQAALEDSLAQSQPDLARIEGELRSQATDGWYTLANTASTRLYLKQVSARLADHLEKVLEPLATLATQYGYDYPCDQLDFIWKRLLENYPHDSICGCSVDAVHRGMMSRFEGVEAAMQTLTQDLLQYLSEQVQSPHRPSSSVATIQVWNASPQTKRGRVRQTIELSQALFSQCSVAGAYEAMSERPLDDLCLVDEQGQIVPAQLVDLGAQFGYDLPDDRFRQAYFARKLELEWLAEVPGMSLAEYYLQLSPEVSETAESLTESSAIENEAWRLELVADGSVTVTDKRTGRVYPGQGCLEETGDVGNEYIFRETTGKSLNQSQFQRSVHVERDALGCQLVIDYHFLLPASADSALEQAQEQVIDVTQRTLARSSEQIPTNLRVTYRLDQDDHGIRIRLSGDNQVLDHRIRLGFSLPHKTERHHVDSAFEYLERSNQVGPAWKNPSNPQVLYRNVAIGDQVGLTVSPQGLPEYEVTGTETGTQVWITCLRGVGELGDWGYFPTPEAQCLGPFVAEVYLQFWEGEAECQTTFARGREAWVPLLSRQLRREQGQVGSAGWKQPLEGLIELPSCLHLTALKQAQDNQDWILRLVNYGKTPLNLSPYLPSMRQEVDLLERAVAESQDWIQPHEIKTYRIQLRKDGTNDCHLD